MRCIGIFFGFDVESLKVCSYGTEYSLILFRPNGVILTRAAGRRTDGICIDR